MTNKTIEEIAREIVEGWVDHWVNSYVINMGGLTELEDAIREALQSQMPSDTKSDTLHNDVTRPCVTSGTPIPLSKGYPETWTSGNTMSHKGKFNCPNCELPIVVMEANTKPQEREMPSRDEIITALRRRIGLEAASWVYEYFTALKARG